MPANFVEQTEYFMVEPKPQEFAVINLAICREQINDTTFVMAVPRSNDDVNTENLPGAFLATVKKGYWEDMSSFSPESSIRLNYGYSMTGIVRALGSGGQAFTAINPDDAGHSPVSDKWGLYVINVTETSAPGLIGDVNVDGLVNISDVTTLIDYLLGGNPQPFSIVDYLLAH